MKITQAFPFRHKVKDATSKLIFINPVAKHIVDTIVEEDGCYYLTASADETKNWDAGRYSYQLQDENGIYERGDFIVLINYAIQDSTSYMSMWQAAIKQIDDLIAGRATSNSHEITVGDKKISYSTLDELLRLRDYFAQRLAEEQELLGEETTYDKTSQKKILYQWRML